mmetsp:Transcript_17839/g.45729  ORF Transcript_17839/g.45729 Transcript_17839/m.45729 type:complete len:632 (-) Transcript_17839:1066-2961(-)
MGALPVAVVAGLDDQPVTTGAGEAAVVGGGGVGRGGRRGGGVEALEGGRVGDDFAHSGAQLGARQHVRDEHTVAVREDSHVGAAPRGHPDGAARLVGDEVLAELAQRGDHHVARQPAALHLRLDLHRHAAHGRLVLIAGGGGVPGPHGRRHVPEAHIGIRARLGQHKLTATGSQAVLKVNRKLHAMVHAARPACVAERLPRKPELERVSAAAALDGLVAEVVLCVELVRLEEVGGLGGAGGLQCARVARDEGAALQRRAHQLVRVPRKRVRALRARHQPTDLRLGAQQRGGAPGAVHVHVGAVALADVRNGVEWVKGASDGGSSGRTHKEGHRTVCGRGLHGGVQRVGQHATRLVARHSHQVVRAQTRQHGGLLVAVVALLAGEGHQARAGGSALGRGVGEGTRAREVHRVGVGDGPAGHKEAVVLLGKGTADAARHLGQHLALHNREDGRHLKGVHVGVGGDGRPIGRDAHGVHSTVKLVEKVGVVRAHAVLQSGVQRLVQRRLPRGALLVRQRQAGTGLVKGRGDLLRRRQLHDLLAAVTAGRDVLHQGVAHAAQELLQLRGAHGRASGVRGQRLARHLGGRRLHEALLHHPLIVEDLGEVLHARVGQHRDDNAAVGGRLGQLRRGGEV